MKLFKILGILYFCMFFTGCDDELFVRKNDYCIVVGRDEGHFVCNADTKNKTCDVRHWDKNIRGLACSAKIYYQCTLFDYFGHKDWKEKHLICSEGVLKNAADYQILYAYDNKNEFILDPISGRQSFEVYISLFVSTYPLLFEENYPQKYKDAAKNIEKEKIESMREELIKLNKQQLEQHYENKNRELERLKNL